MERFFVGTGRKIMLICSMAFCLLFFSAQMTQAAACPVTDGGAGDGDGTVNGTITISSSTSWNTSGYSDALDYIDCTGVDIHITSNSTLSALGNKTNGYIFHLATDNLQIDSGSSISADGQGCSTTATNRGSGPNGSNVCVDGGSGAGTGDHSNTSNRGTGGGGHGGAGGTGSNASFTGGSTYSDLKRPLLFGASGGSAGSGGPYGGAGGGVILLEVAGTLTFNGEITADGAAGSTGNSFKASGGGSGGSILVVSNTIAGTTGSISAAGGVGGNNTSADGGGGGGGRVHVRYVTDSSSFLSGLAASTVTAGGVGPDTASDGATGTLDVMSVTSLESEYSLNIEDSDSDNQLDRVVIVYQNDIASGSINAADYSLNNSYSVASASKTAYATVTLVVTESGSADPTQALSVSLTGAVTSSLGGSMTTGADTVQALACPFITETDGTTDVYANATITPTSSDYGECGTLNVHIEDNVTLTVEGDTSNGYYLNLRANDVTLDSGASFNADEQGCSTTTSNAGSGPNASNVCVDGGSGAGVGDHSNGSNRGTGGGGHGGAGGDGTLTTGGSSYDDNTAPALFGASGGSAGSGGPYGGAGGGIVWINADGTLTINGTISADGGAGQISAGYKASGGGAGGSINLVADTLAGSGALSADGGQGGNATSGDGGGGGGGRIAITFATDSSSIISGGSAATYTIGGAGPDAATDGATGTFYTATAGPAMSSAVTGDTDDDGQIDAVVVTFDSDLDGATVAGSDFTVDSGHTIASASETSTGVVTIVLTESGSGDTDTTPTVTLVSAVNNTSGGSTSSGSVAATDGAAPVATAQTYKDTNADGQIDRLDITFSENIAYDECESGDYSFGGTDAGAIAVASCATSGDDLQLTISNAPANDTNITITFSYTAANGTASSLDDSSGNAVTDISGASVTDGAGPVGISASYTDADANGQVDRLDVVFTESIAIDECEAGDYAIGGADAGSIAVSTCTASGSIMQFGITNAAGGDTNLALTISYTTANGTASSLDDSAGNAVADFGPLTPSDAAAPVIGGMSIQDTNADGLIDELVIDFTENIDTDDGAAPVLADFGTITLPDGQTVTSATLSDPAGASNIVTLTSVAGQVTINTGAGSAGIAGVTNQWTDGTNQTVDPDSNVGIIDDAAPVLRSDGTNSMRYQDNNTDGTVDRVKLVFSEAVTITYADGDWTANANGLTSFDVSGVSTGNGTATVYLTATAASNKTGVGGGGEPSLSFTASSGSISDGSNTLNSIVPTNLVDDAAPALRTDGASAPTYLDANSDGTIDRVRLTFTENATLTYNDGDWTAAANDLTSFDVGAYLSGNGTTEILLTAGAQASLTGVSGGTEPTLAFTASSGSIVDDGGASLASISTASLADGASPVGTNANYGDTNTDGQVDGASITFTEAVTVNECETADYPLGGDDLGSIAISGCSTSGNDVQLTFTGAPANDTNLALTLGYSASNATANSLDDAAGNPVSTIPSQTLGDGARPVLVGFSYTDNDGDGTIDQVTANFTETVTLNYVDSDWTVTANDLTGFDVTGYESGNGSANIILTAVAGSGATGVSGGTEPTIAFSPDTGSVQDGSLNTNSGISATSVDDAAAMSVFSSEYKDVNNDGTVDRLDIRFTENPVLGECEATDYSFAGADAGSIAVSACATNTTDLRLTLSGATSDDTSLSFNWSYAAANATTNSIEDGSGNALASVSNQNPADGAAPIRLNQSYEDVNADGTVDRFDVTFTEDITFDECESGDFTIGGVDAGTLSVSSCATSGNTLQLSVANGSANDTYYAITLAYTAANGTGNSLDDAAGNAVADLGASALTDGALPVASAIAYKDNDTDGQVDRIAVTFTESITLNQCETEDWIIGGSDAGSIAVVDATGCSVSSPSITFTLSGAPANTTALNLTLSYQNNDTAGSLEDQGSQVVTSLAAMTPADEAAPLRVSQSYKDANSDGQIDRLDVTYTEALTASTCEVADHIFAGADAGAITAASCTPSGTDVQFGLSNTPTNNTNLTLTYEYDKDSGTANSLVDASGNVLGDLVASAVSDGAAPVLRTDGANAPEYRDSNSDGTVDQVALVFTENTTITYIDENWTTTANDLTSLDIMGISSGNGGTTVILSVSAQADLTGVSAGTEPALSFTSGSGGSIADSAGNQRVSIASTNLSDAAAPVNVAQSYKDIGENGKVDRLDITFSEYIELNECQIGDYIFGGADAGSIAISSCTTSGTQLRLSLSDTPAQDTNLALTFTYDASNGTAGSLDDSSGNATADINAVTLADDAAPLLISATPAHNATEVANDADVVLTFTEPLSTGSLSYTFTNYTSGVSTAWSSANAVATLSPSSTYDSESTVSFELDAAQDPSGNSLTASLTTNPFSFTIVAYSSASEPSLRVEEAGQYTSLNLYDPADLQTSLSTVEPGQTLAIVWAHNGKVNSTEVYYALDGGPTTLVEVVTGGGTQSEITLDPALTEGTEVQISVVNAQKVSYYATASAVVQTQEEQEPEEEEDTQPLSLIRTDVSSGVYNTFSDGTRKVFIDSLAYFTWYESFEGVETVEVQDMSVYTLTGIMLPKAGTVLVKIQSVPKVYYLEENPDNPHQPILRWIPDEQTAISLFGTDWADYVIDIAPTFFTKFGASSEILDEDDAEWIDEGLLMRRVDLSEM